MNHRILGRTGVSVSVIDAGARQLGGEQGPSYTVEDVAAILRAAREEGIDLIDTGECYGDHLAESLLGAALPGNRAD